MGNAFAFRSSCPLTKKIPSVWASTAKQLEWNALSSRRLTWKARTALFTSSTVSWFRPTFPLAIYYDAKEISSKLLPECLFSKKKTKTLYLFSTQQDISPSYGIGNDGQRRSRSFFWWHISNILRANWCRIRGIRIGGSWECYEESRLIENGQFFSCSVNCFSIEFRIKSKRWRCPFDYAHCICVTGSEQIVANHVVPGLFNSDSFKPHLIYKLPSMFGTLNVHRIETVLKVTSLAKWIN